VSAGGSAGIRHPRPAHLHWRYVGLVALGGTFGTAAREALVLAIPPLGAFPLAVFLINIAGTFLLGLLLEALARHGADSGNRRTLRLLLGTGFLGGFTTYSALAVDSALLVGGVGGLGLLYALGTVVVGAAATWGGIAIGAIVTGRRGGAHA
jgi:CrcB protein